MGVFGGFSSGVKVGMIQPFSGSVVPDGWLKCDGSVISRTLYSELFDVIGTTYGEGDGSTTFRIPNNQNIMGWVSEEVNIKGTGKALGLIAATGKESYLNTNISSGIQALTAPGMSGNSNVLGTVAVAGTNYTDGITGVHTDPTKSGLVGAVAGRRTLVCDFLIKY